MGTDFQAERLEMVSALKNSMHQWRVARDAVDRSAAEVNDQTVRLEVAAQQLRERLWDAAIAWLEEKWGTQRQCPYCDANDWTVGTPLDDILDEGDGKVSPYFTVTCDNCGNTVNVNAVMAGVLPTGEELEEAP